MFFTWSDMNAWSFAMWHLLLKLAVESDIILDGENASLCVM